MSFVPSHGGDNNRKTVKKPVEHWVPSAEKLFSMGVLSPCHATDVIPGNKAECIWDKKLMVWDDEKALDVNVKVEDKLRDFDFDGKSGCCTATILRYLFVTRPLSLNPNTWHRQYRSVEVVNHVNVSCLLQPALICLSAASFQNAFHTPGKMETSIFVVFDSIISLPFHAWTCHLAISGETIHWKLVSGCRPIGP